MRGIWGYWELSSSHQLASVSGSDPWKASQVASHLVRNVFLLFEDLFSLQSTTEDSYTIVYLICKKLKHSKTVSYLDNAENTTFSNASSKVGK